eukprot:3790476-Rhodomonas_salina.1
MPGYPALQPSHVAFLPRVTPPARTSRRSILETMKAYFITICLLSFTILPVLQALFPVTVPRQPVVLWKGETKRQPPGELHPHFFQNRSFGRTRLGRAEREIEVGGTEAALSGVRETRGRPGGDVVAFSDVLRAVCKHSKDLWIYTKQWLPQRADTKGLVFLIH